MTELAFMDGVMPAITTPFTAQDTIDRDFLDHHARTLTAAGCSAIVALGSLGEVATLSADERRSVLQTLLHATPGPRRVIAGIAALGTADAVAQARQAEQLGCAGLMVLPPYVYSTDAREMQAHVEAVIAATALPCILYNNPIAYRTDFTPEQVAALCERQTNLVAIKESSADVRRVSAIRALLGERLKLLMGVDDLIVEGIGVGVSGWIAGLVNALPHESVRLFELARAGRVDEARRLYEWFLPLLRLDTVPKFVQLIKLTQQMVGLGSARVRAPRLALEGDELRRAEAVIRRALETRPALD
ncbi:dihydrodipicolinate synthase family protein [Aquincola sp. S2]|uniref:Dihydrodipicolinate synthase family protein n=1 Tax=Pseudaquabacterium terrae TaxID=2732868 RepID=A0ABX2EFF5_9BURK|nr:dihydrodipicolinate synthase family protein [Aquabacterium terrae]NRF67344.1 dihydrodipicolinate synthase family protein [Aquabacterium terrae]